jgi:hypothetical protein
MWNRNSERPRETPGPLTTFQNAIAKAASDAEAAGVLAVQIYRHLDSIARGYEYKAAIRNAAMGGR